MTTHKTLQKALYQIINIQSNYFYFNNLTSNESSIGK